MVLPFYWSCIMRVTTKGQVTIPRSIREVLGIVSETEIDFREDKGRFYIVKIDQTVTQGQFKKLRGIATANMSTDEIMSLTREP